MIYLNYDKFNFFSPTAVSDEVWNELLSFGFAKSFQKDSQLFTQNQSVSDIVCLKKGSVKTIHIFPNGNEKLYEILESPSVIGYEALFTDSTVLNPNIIALTDLEATVIPVKKVEELVLKKPEFFICFYKFLRNSLLLSRIQSGGAMYLSLLQRTAFALQLMSKSKTDDEGYCLITHQDLSSFIGISRANTTVCLNQLFHMNIIDKKRSRIKILDLKAINKLIDIRTEIENL